MTGVSVLVYIEVEQIKSKVALCWTKADLTGPASCKLVRFLNGDDHVIKNEHVLKT